MLKRILGGVAAPVLAGLVVQISTAYASPINSPLACMPASANEWPQTSPYNRALQPMDCAVIDHDPPVLAWSNVKGATGYEIQLSKATDATFGTSSVISTISTTTPWSYLPSKLGAGNFIWKVRIKGATAWGPARRFQIAAAARDFTVPPLATALKTASSLAHPRAQPTGAERASWLADLTTGSRATNMSELRRRVDGKVGEAMPVDPSSSVQIAGYSTATIANANLAFMNQMTKLSESAREAAFMAMIERKPTVIADAKRRILFLAGLDPNGATSFAQEPLGAARVVWTIAYGYDWLYKDFTAAERATIQASIKGRMVLLLASLTDATEGVAAKPLNSIAVDTLQNALTVASLTVGDIPEATTWFNATYPLFPQWLSPFGGDDGGFASGTNYLIWQLESQENWDALRWTTGVDVMAKSWTHNLGRALVYFYPPGSPFGMFGDGASEDNSEPNGRLFRPYAARAGDPLYSWYNGQSIAGDYSRLQAILAPPLVKQSTLPANTPNSIWLPSVGWTAMHSSLADRARTSVYFKSSGYGSYNHSHADQNTFVINSQGAALLVETGLYDYYGSYNFINWSKTTAAHNGITYDGGKGQGQDTNGKGDVNATGLVSSFRSDGTVDVVSGDASKAYSVSVVPNSPVTKALRTLVYIRPSTVLVFDTLAATVPVSWEWNVHGQVAPSSYDNTRFTIRNGSGSACGQINNTGAMTLTSIVAPTNAAAAGQWHGRYALNNKVANTSYAAVISTDCTKSLPIAVPNSDGSWIVKDSGWTVTYANGLATYTKN